MISCSGPGCAHEACVVVYINGRRSALCAACYAVKNYLFPDGTRFDFRRVK